MNILRKHLLMNEAGVEAGGGGAPAAPAPPPAQSPAPAPAPGAAPPVPGTGAQGVPWLATNVETDLIGLAQTKGWQSAADAVKSYRELEKMMGADRAGRTVTIPTDETDTAGWSQVYDRLGRPANAEGYKLPVPEGHDPAFAREAASEFHKLGISAKTGEALANWWNAQAVKAADGMALKEQQALEAEHTALRKDWGSEHDMRRELARRAAVQLGLDEQAMDAMEKVSGYSKTLKALAKVGDMLREHGAEGMNQLGSFTMTPEGARSRKQQLMADTEWRKRAMDSKSAEWAELQKLDKIISDAAQ